MRDDKYKKIGSAMYLDRSSGRLISFKVTMNGTNCNLIKPMLDETYQTISYIDKNDIT